VLPHHAVASRPRRTTRPRPPNKPAQVSPFRHHHGAGKHTRRGVTTPSVLVRVLLPCRGAAGCDPPSSASPAGGGVSTSITSPQRCSDEASPSSAWLLAPRGNGRGRGHVTRNRRRLESDRCVVRPRQRPRPRVQGIRPACPFGEFAGRAASSWMGLQSRKGRRASEPSIAAFDRVPASGARESTDRSRKRRRCRMLWLQSK
jgi:hypothetical protein